MLGVETFAQIRALCYGYRTNLVPKVTAMYGGD